MEVNPPPYNPQLPAYYPPRPSAPGIGNEPFNPGAMMIGQGTLSPVFLQQSQALTAANPGGNACASPSFSYPPPPPQYTPTITPNVEVAPPVPERQPIAPSPAQSNTNPANRPLRCKAGTVEVGFGDSANIDHIRAWKTQYLEVRDNTIYMSQSKSKRNEGATISLKDRYISMPGRKLVSIEGGNGTSCIIKCSSDVLAHEWFMALSQYCYVAPMMDGYCDKMSRGKKIFEERFVRLCSEGVVSWYRSDSDDSERRGAIQVRGVRCVVDGDDSRIIHAYVEPKGYQFRFSTHREAQLWLIALQWHYGRKPLRKACVPIRNKAK